MSKIYYLSFGAAYTYFVMALAGCTELQRAGLAEALPTALPAVAGGGAGAVVNPANPFAWWEVASGLALITAALIGGPSAVRKVKAFFGKK